MLDEELSATSFTQELDHIRAQIWRGCTSGLVTSMTFADYFFCSFLLKGLLQQYSTMLVASSTAYFTAYYSILVFVPCYAVSNNITTYVSQLKSNPHQYLKKRVLLQGLASQLILLIVLNAVGFFFLEDLLLLLGAEEAIVPEAYNQIVMAFPPMALRCFNDNIKFFLSTQPCFQRVGLAFWGSFILFPFYSFLFVAVLRLDSLGFVLSLAGLEIVGSFLLMYFFFTKVDPGLRNSRIPGGIFRNFRWFFVEVLKSVLIFCPSWIAFDFILYFISFSADRTQIFVFTFYETLCGAISSLGIGIRNSHLNLFSEKLASKNFVVAKKTFLDIMDIENRVIIAFNAMGTLCMFIYVQRSNFSTYERWIMNECLIGLFFNGYSFWHTMILGSLGNAVEMKGTFTFLNLVFGVFTRLIVAYIFCVWLRLGAIGGLLAQAI